MNHKEHGNHRENQHHKGKHQNHHAKMIADFRRRFWIGLLLTLPIIALAPLIQEVVGYDWPFTGDAYVQFGLSSILFPDFRTSPALKSQLAYIQSFKFFKQVSWVSQREILFILCRCLCAEKRTKVGRYPSRSLTKAVESIRSSIRSGAAITCMKWIGFSVKVSNGSPTA